MKLAKDIGALKAVSQNLMHSNLGVTDGVYGVLSGIDVREQIAGLNELRGQIGKALGNGRDSDIDLIAERVAERLREAGVMHRRG